MSIRAAAALLVWLLPSVALGATFAQSSLFLSKPAVTEGEVVLIHATVNNDSGVVFKGDLVFGEGEETIGTVPVSLGINEAQVASISWKPSAGKHVVVAKLRSDGKTVEESRATFSIAAKPEPAASAAAVGSSQNIQNGIASFSPAAAEATAPFFKLVDGGRAQVAALLDEQITSTKQSLNTGQSGEVLGAEDAQSASKNPMDTFWYILRTIYLYILTLLSFVVGSAGVFYPLLAAVALYLLWRLFRMFRRPTY